MPSYLVECRRIREVLETCKVTLEAASAEEALARAEQMEDDGDLDFADSDDLPDWSGHEFEIHPIEPRTFAVTGQIFYANGFHWVIEAATEAEACKCAKDMARNHRTLLAEAEVHEVTVQEVAEFENEEEVIK
jgi:hypothetical protein